jgi:hypothetical protein
MNWLHFFLWVGGIYALYYFAVILFDVAGARRAPAAGSQTHELTFSENVAPIQMSADKAAVDESTPKTQPANIARERKQEPEMIASGGVVIDNLFKLCKQESVIYTRSVSFGYE